MRSLKKTGLAVVAAILGITGIAVSAPVAGTADNTDHCAINAETAHGAISFTGLANGNAGDTGMYRMTVTGGSNGGSTSISQGGAFVLDDTGKADIGQARLNAGGIYDVQLELSLEGQTYRCAETFGDRI